MIKPSLYANENLRLDLINALRNLGYNVLTSREAKRDNQKILDDLQLQFAKDQNRVLITYNRKDFLKLHREGQSHQGIICCRENIKDYEYAQWIDDKIQDFLSQDNNFQNQILDLKGFIL
jgi:hypothetical protein